MLKSLSLFLCVKHGCGLNNGGGKFCFLLRDTHRGKFFLTNFRICKAMTGPRESFPLRMSVYRKGQIINIRPLKRKSPGNSESREIRDISSGQWYRKTNKGEPVICDKLSGHFLARSWLWHFNENIRETSWIFHSWVLWGLWGEFFSLVLLSSTRQTSQRGEKTNLIAHVGRLNVTVNLEGWTYLCVSVWTLALGKGPGAFSWEEAPMLHLN